METFRTRESTPADVARAAAAAGAACTAWSGLAAAERADALDAVADALAAEEKALVEAADAETSLGPARLTGELARTTVQLQAFAELLREGSYVDPVIDHADPAARPAPRPDIRRMSVPIGPVAVFGASNFPFAFGVAGGDTASALAAGCSVVVKGHPSHPATSALVGAALMACLPDGVCNLVQGASPSVGEAMVRAPEIKAVGFTGSLAGGRALYDLAAARPEPIPVYAEMGSLNPVFVSPGARAARGADVAAGLAASVLMGSGQFCTKPGVAFVVGDDEARAFGAQVAAAMASGPPHALLNERVLATLRDAVSASTGIAGVERVLVTDDAGEGWWHPAVVLTAGSDTYRREHALRTEHFGPVVVVVRCRDEDDQAALAASMEGSLTASLFAEAGEDGWAARLTGAVTDRAGRVIWGGYPTGVAVTHAMHHGGPYPATTAPAFTSVGTAAIRRFLRPVAYQGFPDSLLPPALQEANPLGLHRHVDGVAVAPLFG